MSIFVIGRTAGQDAAFNVVKSNIMAVPVWMVTVAAIYFTLRAMPLIPALSISLLVWLASAWVFMYFTE